LILHRKWLNNEKAGVQADLRGVDFRGVNLRGIDFLSAGHEFSNLCLYFHSFSQYLS